MADVGFARRREKKETMMSTKRKMKPSGISPIRAMKSTDKAMGNAESSQEDQHLKILMKQLSAMCIW